MEQLCCPYFVVSTSSDSLKVSLSNKGAFDSIVPTSKKHVAWIDYRVLSYEKSIMYTSKCSFPMCYRLASYSEHRGKVNEKMRHISSLHFLVLFLACQTALPVKAKLHSDSASCIQKYPRVCVCARICGCLCVFIHMSVCMESLKNP